MGSKKRQRHYRPSSHAHRISRRYTHNRRILIEERRKPQAVPELPDGAAWYVVQTGIRAELRAQRNLEARGFVSFLPLYERTRIVPGVRRSDPMELALLPGYLFVAMARSGFWRDQDAALVWDADGVAGILSNDGRPVPVPSRMLAALATEGAEAARFDGDGRRIPAAATFAAGDRLTVSAGPFAGLPARVEEAPAAERLIVLIGCFGGEVRATVAVEDVEAA